jgi:hypothetical protein
MSSKRFGGSGKGSGGISHAEYFAPIPLDLPIPREYADAH